MAQVPLRMAQPGLIPPHQQRPPMMVSMTQPPPVSMQGLVSMAPMMGPGGGMAVMTQSMSHPDSTHEHHHHAMNGPYGGPPHHPHPPPPHHPGPRSHVSQHHHTAHHQSGATQQTHAGPPPTQYHPHPPLQQSLGGPHNVQHSVSHGGHHGHSASHIAANCNIGTTAPHHGHMQNQSQPQHSITHQPVNNLNTANITSNQQHSIVSQGQSHQTYVAGPIMQPSQPNNQIPLTVDKGPTSGGLIVLSNNSAQNRTNISSNNATNGLNEVNSMEQCTNYDNPIQNGSDNMSMREKTPMCLINELARYNKIQHQYCLTDEKGPAHKKIFTVTLRIGETEEYTSSGASIKKAQHSAASIALKNTKFKHPPPKPPRQMQQPKLTPTVELNALAMKRGEAPIYSFVEAPRPPLNPYTFNVSPNVRTMYNQKYYCRPPLYSVFFVSLKVGIREFMGEGTTAQQAKHNAASKALKSIKTLPMPKNSCPSPADLTELDPNADLKSPISLVHEIALKRNLQVMFEVVRESGPPHMRTFITTCIVGDFRTQGEGTGKKASKTRAAELMLEKLRSTLPPLPPNTLGVLKRKPTTKKKSRNLIKVGQEEQKAAPEYGQGINPISRLIQIQQAKKEKEPIYTLIAERGVPRRREFVMQVSVGNEIATGSGQNKKLAKRAAAESMLQVLGYSRSPPIPVKPAIKMEGSHNDSDKTRKQVTFMEETTELSHISNNDSQMNLSNVAGGRQLVPGLIMMTDGSALHGYQQIQETNNIKSSVNIHATAAIAKELLECGSSATAKAMVTPQTSHSHQQVSSMNHTAPSVKNTCSQHVPQRVAVNRQNQQTPVQNNSLQAVQNNSNTIQQQYSHTQQPVQIQNISENTSSNNQNTNRNSLSINNTTSEQAVRPKDQLMYLANILSLQVQFTDFPKGNKSEYLSLVSLSTKPPHVSHGAGSSIDASHDQACLNALRNLAEMGLDSVTPNSDKNAS